MHSKEALSMQYYNLQTGEKDEFAYALNCLDAQLYLCLKNSVSHDRLVKIFLQNFNIQISLEGKVPIDMGVEWLDYSLGWSNLIQLKSIMPKPEEALSTLKRLIDYHTFVLLQTVNVLLPFDARYGEFDPRELEDFEPHHTNLLI